MTNDNVFLQEFFDLVNQCENPSDLIALFNSQNGEAGNTLANLFDKSFMAGFNRKGAKV